MTLHDAAVHAAVDLQTPTVAAKKTLRAIAADPEVRNVLAAVLRELFPCCDHDGCAAAADAVLAALAGNP